jgi:hypothetical protein
VVITHGKYFLFSLLLPVFLNSCDDLLKIDTDKEAFEREWAAWNSQNFKEYQFTYSFFNDAGPLGPVRITVKENGESVIEDQYNGGLIARNIAEIYEYINGTFDFIETVEKGTYNGPKINSIGFDIAYNTQYHYPQTVNLSVGYNEPLDGGPYYTLKITEFNPIKW